MGASLLMPACRFVFMWLYTNSRKLRKAVSVSPLSWSVLKTSWRNRTIVRLLLRSAKTDITPLTRHKDTSTVVGTYSKLWLGGFLRLILLMIIAEISGSSAID